jgi:hypothetical protein
VKILPTPRPHVVIGSEADDEASYAYRREGRAEERAAIVAWLRIHAEHGQEHGTVLRIVAHNIERGEHEEPRRG